MPSASQLIITIPPDAPRDTALDGLARRLRDLDGQEFVEARVSHGGYPVLCALINRDCGWLSLMRHEGDAGFRSENPSFAGARDETLTYFLSNGQRDEYPASWAYPRAQVIEALAAFARQARVPSWVRWADA